MMISQIFDWSGWYVKDVMSLTFYNVVLNTQVGPFPSSMKFESAVVNYETGQLRLHKNDYEYYDFKLKTTMTVE